MKKAHAPILPKTRTINYHYKNLTIRWFSRKLRQAFEKKTISTLLKKTLDSGTVHAIILYV